MQSYAYLTHKISLLYLKQNIPKLQFLVQREKMILFKLQPFHNCLVLPKPSIELNIWNAI